MTHQDYYFVLGIPRDESARGIRKAFRDQARRHHPDRAGPNGAPRFRDVVEAYRVLSDPEQRRAYDADRATAVPVRDECHEEDLSRAGIEWCAPARRRPARNLFCDVVLSRREARSGGILPVRIPVRICAHCRGAGPAIDPVCARCGATGMFEAELTIPLVLPPRTRTGAIVELSLDRFGMRGVWVRARIRIAA
jgi:DnaJ-class molecular chaperone